MNGVSERVNRHLFTASLPQLTANGRSSTLTPSRLYLQPIRSLSSTQPLNLGKSDWTESVTEHVEQRGGSALLRVCPSFALPLSHLPYVFSLTVCDSSRTSDRSHTLCPPPALDGRPHPQPPSTPTPPQDII